MVINNNTVEQINVALLDLDKKLSQINADTSTIESLRNDVSAIKRTLNETRSGLQSGATYNINITGNASTATRANLADTANTAETAITAETATNADITRTADTTNGDKLQIGNGTAANIVNAKNAANDINGDKIDTTYQKVADKNSVAGYVHCDKTANGTYILKATVTNGTVTYAWVQEI
jgi:hypothetical protein